MMQWVPGPRRPRRKTTGIRDWGRVWSPTLKMVSTRAAPSSQPGSTSFTPDHPTPALPSSASLPDGNASPTVKRQRYSASTRRVGKRNQLQHLDGCPELRSGLLAGCQNGFDSGRSFVAARLNQLHPRPPNASPPVIRQPSRRERQPNRQTPALQRKHTTTRQANPAPGPRTHPTPTFPTSASPPDGSASPTAERQRYSASTRPQGKRNQPRGPRFRLGPLVPRGPAQPALEGATPPVISALTRSIPWKTAIKIKGLSAFRTFP